MALGERLHRPDIDQLGSRTDAPLDLVDGERGEHRVSAVDAMAHGRAPAHYGSSGWWSGDLSATGSPSHDVAGVAQYLAIASRRGA